MVPYITRSGGWFAAAESSKDKEAIVTLLRPDGGQFFRMLIERGQDRYCDFPVDKLPVKNESCGFNLFVSSLSLLISFSVVIVDSSSPLLPHNGCFSNTNICY
jgi:hypothetical protein